MNTFRNTSLGNDVVDFLDPDSIDLRENPRFIRRVFNLSEADENTEPRHLWRIWAAKEASYKAVKRLHTNIVFSPGLFLLTSYNQADHTARVEYKNLKIHVKFSETSDYTHALAIIPADGHVLETEYLITEFNQIQSDLKGTELIESYSLESSLCRSWAIKTLQKYHNSDKIQIIKSPESANVPEVWVNGIRTNQLISLSHHGRFCGLFYTIPQSKKIL